MKFSHVEEFAQFGLAGLVILALFFVLYQLINGAMKRYDSVMSEHRSERKEWRESEDKRSERMDRTLNELTASIRRIDK